MGDISLLLQPLFPVFFLSPPPSPFAEPLSSTTISSLPFLPSLISFCRASDGGEGYGDGRRRTRRNSGRQRTRRSSGRRRTRRNFGDEETQLVADHIFSFLFAIIRNHPQPLLRPTKNQKKLRPTKKPSSSSEKPSSPPPSVRRRKNPARRRLLITGTLLFVSFC